MFLLASLWIFPSLCGPKCPHRFFICNDKVFMKTDPIAFKDSAVLRGAKPITYPISNNRQLVSVLIKIHDKRVTMNSLHSRTNRGSVILLNIINQRHWSDWNQQQNACSVRGDSTFFLYSHNMSASLSLHAVYLIPPLLLELSLDSKC